MTNYSRRNWMKSAAGLTAGMMITSAWADQLFAAPVSKAEEWLNPLAANGKLVRLGSNENPYGPSAKARKALVAAMDEFNRYANDGVNELKKAIAAKEGVSADHVLVTAGSSETLCLTGMGAGLEGGSVLSAYPTFRLLMDYAEKFNARWDKVDLNSELVHDLPALASALKSDTRILFLCNPNNPTGTFIPGDQFKNFCQEMSKKTTVFVDEAYIEFLEPDEQRTMVELVKEGQNVIVSRTFSKVHGLAGLRIAYAIAPPDVIKKLARFQMGAVINQAALAAAKASLEDHEFAIYTRKKNNEALAYFSNYLSSKGWIHGKSRANVVLFPAPKSGKQILEQTLAKGFQIRVWDYKEKEWCRVSIGTLEEMKLFTKAFDEVIG